MPNKPRGSGIFAIIFGVLFFIALFCTPQILKISPVFILKTWFGFVGAILLWWGVYRVWTTTSDSFAVGQDTINWVVAIFAATLALLDIVNHPH
jgi:hypothetical protein